MIQSGHVRVCSESVLLQSPGERLPKPKVAGPTCRGYDHEPNKKPHCQDEAETKRVLTSVEVAHRSAFPERRADRETRSSPVKSFRSTRAVAPGWNRLISSSRC